ncbi:MAG: AbiV family abortive infection protein [Candidatus Lokiarchaeota archaeon]|nr:AbiV family abortive infection protein [Candidatus Lokiarchaeota archaeon]
MPSMVNLKKFSKKQLLQGMNLALKNARLLLKEAKLLAKNKAYSRAFALGVLSLEEAGKVVFLTLCYHEDRFTLSEKGAKKFWKLFSSHPAKISFFEDFYAGKWKSFLFVRKRKHQKETYKFRKKVIEPLYKAYTDIYTYLRSLKLSSVSELKLRCFYVDSSNKKLNFHMPYSPPPRVIKGLLLLVKCHIEDAAKLRDTFRRARTAEISEQVYMTMFKHYDLRATLHELEKMDNA